MDSEELGTLTEGWVIKVTRAHSCLLDALWPSRFLEPFRPVRFGPAVSPVTVLAQPFRPRPSLGSDRFSAC